MARVIEGVLCSFVREHFCNTGLTLLLSWRGYTQATIDFFKKVF